MQRLKNMLAYFLWGVIDALALITVVGLLVLAIHSLSQGAELGPQRTTDHGQLTNPIPAQACGALRRRGACCEGCLIYERPAKAKIVQSAKECPCGAACTCKGCDCAQAAAPSGAAFASDLAPIRESIADLVDRVDELESKADAPPKAEELPAPDEPATADRSCDRIAKLTDRLRVLEEGFQDPESIGRTIEERVLATFKANAPSLELAQGPPGPPGDAAPTLVLWIAFGMSLVSAALWVTFVSLILVR